MGCNGEDDVDEDRARQNQALDLLAVCRAVRPTPEVSGSRETLREGLGIGGLVEEEVREGRCDEAAANGNNTRVWPGMVEEVYQI